MQPKGSSPQPTAALVRFIAGARTRFRRAHIGGLALSLSTGLGIALILGALSSSFGASPPLITGIELLSFLGAATLSWFVYGRAVIRDATNDRAIASRIDALLFGKHQEATDTLRSAVELVRDHGRFGESPELSQEAIQRALQFAEAQQASQRINEYAQKTLKWSGFACAGTLLVVAGFGIGLPDALRDAWVAPFSWDSFDSVLERRLPEPRLGDIRLTYRYPAYSERPQRTVRSPTGDIEALPGTEVEIETRARDRVERATLLVSYGDADQSEPAKMAVEVDGRRLRAKLVVQKSGRYRFRLVTAQGESQEERRGHEIELELDESPKVVLLEPEESPIELNEGDRLGLMFGARDDFALGEAHLHWRVLGTAREGRVRLTSAPTGQRRYQGSAQVEISTLALQPGDRVAYTVEVKDNDTVNGPKVGASATQEFRIYSKRAHHEQVMALMEQSLDELVHILGDNLESAFEPAKKKELYQGLLKQAQRIVRRAEAADTLLTDTITAIRKDPLGKMQVADAFEEARKDLRSDTRTKRRAVREAVRVFERRSDLDNLTRQKVKRRQDRMVNRLEKNVVYLADLLNDQRMLDAEALAKQLREEQQALRQALQEYKTAPTAEKRAALAQAIQEIRKRINETMAQLAKTQSSIPQDFVNQEAMTSPQDQANMDEVQRMIEEGNLDDAMEALDRMLGQTERMLAGLQEGREELQYREYSEITERAERLWKDLQEVERDQRDLADRTEALSRKVKERMESKLGDGQAFIEKQTKRIEEAERMLEKSRAPYMPNGDLHDLTQRRLEDGRRALQGKDFGAAQEVLQKAYDQMGVLENEAARRADRSRRFGNPFGMGAQAEVSEKALRRARPPVEDVLKDIQALMPSPDTLLSPEERAQLDRMNKRQAELGQRAGQIGQDLQALGEQLPIVGPEVPKMVDDARQAMNEAEQSLGQGDAPGALGQERAALDKLGQLRKELEKMGQQQQGGGQGGGVPLPFGQRQGQPGGESGRSRDPRSTEKVDIPKPDQYKAPVEFREDILEAAKQGTVQTYKDAVRRYYEELVK